MRRLALVVAILGCGCKHSDCKVLRAKAMAAFVELAAREQAGAEKGKQAQADLDAELDGVNKAASEATTASGEMLCAPISAVVNGAKEHTAATVSISREITDRGTKAVAAARQLQNSRFIAPEDKTPLALDADDLERALPAWTAVADSVVDGKPFPPKVVAAAKVVIKPWCDMWPIASRVAETGHVAASKALDADRAKRELVRKLALEHELLAKAATTAATTVGETTAANQLALPQAFAANEPEFAEAKAATDAAVHACR